MHRLSLALFVVVVLLAALSFRQDTADWVRPRTIAAQGDCQMFPETGKSVCGIFLSYWRANGGLAQQGLPISDVFPEQSSNGQTYDTQYFERAAFERHPENAGTRFEVLLSLLGREKFSAKYPSGRTDGTGVAGERIARGDTALTVIQVTRSTQPLDQNGRPCQAKPGYTIVTIEVLEENIGTEPHNYNRFNYGLKDAAGLQYDEPSSCYPEFLINSGELAPGEKLRGVVLYEVREDAQGLVLEYSLFQREGTRIRITLS